MVKRKNMNILSGVLGIIGLFLMLTQEGYLWIGFGIALVGAILWNGLPTKSQMKFLLKASPGVLMVTIAFVILYVKKYGYDETSKDLIATFFAVFFVNNVVVAAVDKWVR